MKVSIIAGIAVAVMFVSCGSQSLEKRTEKYQTEYEGMMSKYEGMLDEVYSDTTLSPQEIQDSRSNIVDMAIVEMKDLARRTIRSNGDNDLGLLAFQNLVNECEVSPDETLEFIEMLSESVQENEFVAAVKTSVKNLKNTAPGCMFTDFTVSQDPENPETSKVNFSDYVGRGKYVLVDFWASWCGPCKREIPNIKEVYEQFAGEKFDVLSVAVWDKPEDTAKAAKEHGVVWNQIVNAQKIPTEIYGIDGIPHIMLIGPDGTIIARNLRGDGIAEAVVKALGN